MRTEAQIKADHDGVTTTLEVRLVVETHTTSMPHVGAINAAMDGARKAIVDGLKAGPR